MRRFFSPLQSIVLLLSCCLAVTTLVSCSAPPNPGRSAVYQGGADISADPESAAMEAFARANLLSIDGDFEGSLVAIDQAIAIDPEAAYLRLSRAEILLHLGRLDQAKTALEEVLKRDPEQLDALITLAEIQTALGDHAAAITSLTAAGKLQPNDREITLQLALAHARNSDLPEAATLLERLLKESPDYDDAYLALARVRQMSRQPSSAIAAYRRLLELDPGHEQATLELGTLYIGTGQLDQAIDLYRDYLERVPENSRIRYQLVRLYLDRDQLQPALEQLEAISSINPDDLDARYKTGLIYLQQRKFDLAEQAFRAVLKESPDNATTYALGIALEEEGRLNEALAIFEQIPTDSDQYTDAVIHRAYLLPKLDRNRDAIDLLERRLKELDQIPELYEYLAALYGKEKNWGKAKSTLAEGLGQFPDNVDLLLRQALLLDQAGDQEGALQAAQKIQTLQPDNAEALNFIAYAYAVQNVRLDEAESLVLKAIDLGDAPHIRDTYGWVLFRMQRYDDALQQLQLAIAGLPDDPTVLEHLGDLYRVMGRDVDALNTYRKSLDGGRAADPQALQKKIDALQKR